MRLAACFLLSVFLFFASSLTHATDPGPLQDFCVGIVKNPPVFVNGFVCKNPAMVQADDFFFTGLNKSGNTSNSLGSIPTRVFVDALPGLNTLGISLARIDFAAHGVNPPHIHPRATELLIVAQGTLFAGFVTSNQDGNRLFRKTLQVGDVFVIPTGLIHFQANIGNTNAVVFVYFSSQFPGVATIDTSVFGSNPPISDDILAKAFQVDNGVIDLLKAQFK